MNINSFNYHEAEISLGYEDVNIIKNALEVYALAGKSMYAEGNIKAVRLFRAFDSLDTDMVENLKKALEV